MALGCLIPERSSCWTPITTADILPILGLGICGLFAPFMVAVALRKADASLIAAFDFLRLPFTACSASCCSLKCRTIRVAGRRDYIRQHVFHRPSRGEKTGLSLPHDPLRK